MASFADLGKMLGEAGEAIIKPAVPELAERGTADMPSLLQKFHTAPPEVTQRPNQPQVTGTPEVEKHLEMTYDPQSSLSDGIQAFKSFLGGAIKRDPNLPKDIQAKFLKSRQAEESASHMADFELSKILEPMQNDPATQTTIWAKHLLASDELAQAMRDGRPDIMGEPIDKWKSVVSELQSKVDADPQIAEAHSRYRSKMDTMFGDAMGRGWIAPERYLDDYTPIRKLHAVADASSAAAGQDFRLNLLSMLKSRTGAAGERESNLINMLRSTMAQYHRHVAEHELWMDLTSDPTIDLTDKVPAFTDPPKGFARYMPGPGAIGYAPAPAPQQFINGAQDALGGMKNGRVLPTPIVEALQDYRRSMHSARENQWYKFGNAISRQFTIYNPGNTNVNRGSDLLVALTRAPEMGVSPMGLLRWYGTANKVAFRGVFGKGSTIVNINGQPVDVWEMAINQGLPASTLMHDVGGVGIPQQFLKNMPEAQRNYDNWWQNLQIRFGSPLQALAAERQAVELAPRIAAGLDALQRTGNPNEFGRVGKEITFHYGAGAPRWATFPALRLIAPFIQFNGLASEWVLNTLNLTHNSPTKIKAIAAMVAVPTATMMWNSQNQDYQQVEESLHDQERNIMHIIVPDPLDPAKPRRDINGGPVVLRFKWWVPEQVAQLAGLGNLPSRVQRMAVGRDTPMKFAEDTGKQSADQLTGMLVTPEVLKEFMTGKTDTGRDLTWRDRIMRLSPLARIGMEGAQTAKDYGPTEGLRVMAEKWLGLSFASTARRSTTLLDAQFRDATQKQGQAKASLITAIRNGTPQQVRDSYAELKKWQSEVVRLAPIVRKDQEQASEAPAPSPVRTSAIQQELEKIKADRDKGNQ